MVDDAVHDNWRERTVPPDRALSSIQPGMRIFLGTGVAEPRTLVKHLLGSALPNLLDLELIQLAGFGRAVAPGGMDARKFRFKTFASARLAAEAVASGRVDLFPCRFSAIPGRIRSGDIPMDAAFVQVSPPDEAGWCSLGPTADVAKPALAAAALRIGEISPHLPRTSGDTRVRAADFHWLVLATEPPVYFDRWPVDPVTDRLAGQVAEAVDDGSCLALGFGPLFEALCGRLTHRRDLGVHTPFFTDALMDLVNSGAVTNRRKRRFPGKSVAAYAVGTARLWRWLDQNPLVAFYGIDRVLGPLSIGRNPGVVAVIAADRADLTGRIGLPAGRGTAAAGPEEVMDLVNGAELSEGGVTIFALHSRGPDGRPNIRPDLSDAPHPFSFREAVDLVATEFGVAVLRGKTLRERAQALIDVAHPEDRTQLAEWAKARHLLYPDQVVAAACPRTLLAPPAAVRTLRDGAVVRFRGLRPSDEEGMRRLFYGFSDQTVYYRYFSPVRSMPHAKMQAYVNVDCATTVSIVGGTGPTGRETIIAEARYIRDPMELQAETAFVVDEAFQRRGIGPILLELLIGHARSQGITAFTADVLASNRGMMTVFERSGLPVTTRLSGGTYIVSMSLLEPVGPKPPVT